MKSESLRSLRRLTGEQVAENVVRGQYAEGAINGKAAPAYRAEKNVKPIRKRNIRRAPAARGQLALGRRAVLRPGRQTAPDIGHGDFPCISRRRRSFCSQELTSLDQNVLVIRFSRMKESRADAGENAGTVSGSNR